MNTRYAAVVLWSFFLCACGGEGGGGSSSVPVDPTTMSTSTNDGLGPTGQVESARAVSGNTMVFSPTVALDDSNRGLIVWSDYDPNDPAGPAQAETFYSTRSDANGNWQAPQQLPVNQQPGGLVGTVPVLRSNSQGHAVANFQANSQPNLLRFDPDTGWFAIPAPIVDAETALTFGEHADPLLADGALPILVAGRTTNGSFDPFTSRGTVKVFTQRGTENFNLRYETPEFDGLRVDLGAALTVVSQNQADLYFTVNPDEHSPTGESIQADLLDLEGDGMLLPSASPVFFPTQTGCRTRKFASSESSSRVAAIPLLAADNVTCQLFLVRSASPLDPQISQLVTADDFSLDVDDRSRFFGVDSRGNALAVWREVPTANVGTGIGARLMWSQSLAGGTWSTPQPLLGDAAGFGQAFSAQLVMNRSGQVAAAVSTLQFSRTYLTTARFSFESGWSNFTRTANLLSVNRNFDVAINSQGAALAAYVQLPCTRQLPEDGGVALNCNPDRIKPMIYAVQF